MTYAKKILAFVFLGSVGFTTAAEAGSYFDSSSYNGPTSAQQNSPSDASLRDANGNLTLVDGQFTSANFSQNTGVQTASAGVGMGGAGTASGTATAVGNSLNVTTIGFNNTVVVNSTQTNSGNQTASVQMNGH